MNAPLILPRKGKPEVHIDVPAVVGQFLTDVTVFDLVVELVQNELDAGSSKTIIAFGTDALVCEGNGKSIDPWGWERLRHVLGAGGEVAAKVDGIGAKNHGLRSAFLLGDTIGVQSDGYRIDLTVRGDQQRPSRFFPAVWPKIHDDSAPKKGTRVTVPYRKQPLEVASGDQITLAPELPERLEALFKEAIQDSPDRFIGASAPGRKWKYELTLSFHGKETRFIFSCEPLKGKYAGFFRRTCSMQEDGKRFRLILRQLASSFELKLRSDDKGKVPRLFRRGVRFICEISWNFKKNYDPLPGCGALRYPIGFPIENVRSGYGFNISGPFICGRARHSISDHSRNDDILEAGRTAFVEVVRKKLIPLFGPRALDLVLGAGYTDSSAEKKLIDRLLASSALPIAEPRTCDRRRLSKASVMALNDTPHITLPRYSFDTNRVCPELVWLATSVDSVLHPSVHERIVEVLSEMHKSGDKRIRVYDERTAARLFLIDQAPSIGEPAPSDWIDRVKAVLSALETARQRNSLSPELTQDIKTKGKLPTSAGVVAQWWVLRRSLKVVPSIPGVVDPSILPSDFLDLKMLKDSALRIPVFNLDDFVLTKDFSKAGAGARLSFFKWLRSEHPRLKSSTLAELAGYQIWLGADGEYRSLSYYCWPKSPELRALVHSARVSPAKEVINFRKLRQSHSGGFRMRTDPTEEEIKDWYKSATAAVSSLLAGGNVDQAADAVNKIETGLSYLQGLEKYKVQDIAVGHYTFSRAKNYGPVQPLHALTSAVSECRLMDSDIVRGSHTKLYLALGAQHKPSLGALFRALVADPDYTLLFHRLDLYGLLGDLRDLTGEPIITVKGKAMSPATLTFPGTINWWGEWKATLEKVPSVPHWVKLLERVGVVRQALREDLSRGFFEWLSDQPEASKKRHIQQIIRHWGDIKHGPGKWIEEYPTIQCIPVYGWTVELEVLNFRQITARSAVFLPDFRELHEDLLKDFKSARLAITSAKNVVDSVLDVMGEAGVPSLRAKIGSPVRILTSEDIGADPHLESLLSHAQSKVTLNLLTQKLPEFKVPVRALRRDWRKRLQLINGARVAGRITAVYSILRREYEVQSDSAFDERTGLLCINRNGDRKLCFYTALASHLFVEDSNPLWAYGLLLAVESRYQPTLFDFKGNEDPTDGEEEKPLGDGEVTPGEPAKHGHGLSPDKLHPITPSPGPLADIGGAPNDPVPKNQKKRGKRAKSSTASRRNSIEEAEQIFELKEKHYAWHCQACLGQYQAIQAAPPRSYVSVHSIRRKLVEAHHVDHLQNEGAVGAKNLVVLCAFHHDYLGDHLSSDVIKDALAKAEPATRLFPVDADGNSFVTCEGIITNIKIDTSGTTTKLYFTHQHAKAWLTAK